MITAEAVRTNQLSGADQVILDIRSQADFKTKGHIEGAVQVDFANLLTYYKTNNLQNRTTVVIACYSGQTAGYAVGLLRLLGYINVFDLKWGMLSWNQDVANSCYRVLAIRTQQTFQPLLLQKMLPEVFLL